MDKRIVGLKNMVDNALSCVCSLVTGTDREVYMERFMDRRMYAEFTRNENRWRKELVRCPVCGEIISKYDLMYRCKSEYDAYMREEIYACPHCNAWIGNVDMH